MSDESNPQEVHFIEIDDTSFITDGGLSKYMAQQITNAYIKPKNVDVVALESQQQDELYNQSAWLLLSTAHPQNSPEYVYGVDADKATAADVFSFSDSISDMASPQTNAALVIRDTGAAPSLYAQQLKQVAVEYGVSIYTDTDQYIKAVSSGGN